MGAILVERPCGGIVSLEGQAGGIQTFADDTNVAIVSASNVHTVTWVGTLAKARQHAATVYTDQANTWSTGVQDMGSASSFVVPKSAGANPTADGDLRFDTTRDSYVAGSSSTGAKGFLPRLLSSQVASADSLVAATIGTTETAFATLYNVPADFFSAAKQLQLVVAGKCTTSAGAPNVTIRIRYGGVAGTVLYTSNTTSISSQTNVGWGMDCTIANIGASSSSASLYTHNTAAAPTGAGAAPPTNNKTDQPVTAGTTSAKDLVVTLQFSANTAGNTWSLQLFRLVEW